MNILHLQLKPYKCQYCEYSSGQSYNVSIHEKSVHLKIRYKCEHCESSFAQKSWLKVHVKKMCRETQGVDGNRSTSIFGQSFCNNLKLKYLCVRELCEFE